MVELRLRRILPDVQNKYIALEFRLYYLAIIVPREPIQVTSWQISQECEDRK